MLIVVWVRYASLFQSSSGHLCGMPTGVYRGVRGRFEAITGRVREGNPENL